MTSQVKTKNLDEMLKDAISLVKSIGITPGKIRPKVIINKRAIGMFGRCKRKYVNGIEEFEIEISQYLLESEEGTMNTLIHEVLHTCKGCLNHGKIWTSYANKVTRELGYKITRTSTCESKGIKPIEPKYLVKCVSCGSENGRHRMTKLISKTELYRCTCGGHLKRIK